MTTYDVLDELIVKINDLFDSATGESIVGIETLIQLIELSKELEGECMSALVEVLKK